MASTFQARIEDYVGTVSDTTQITDLVTAGAKIIVNAIPENKLDIYASPLTDSGSGNGVAISSYRLVRAHKNGYNARRINPGLKTQAGLSTSLFKATTTSPVWYVENGTAYVLPSGGYVIGVGYPTTLTYNSTSISNFPTEWEHAVVLFAVIQILISKSNVALDACNALTLDSVSAPSAPSAPSFSYTSAAYSDVTYTNATWIDAIMSVFSQTTIGSLGTPPTYTKPSISMTTAPSALDLSSITLPTNLSDFTLTAVPPTPPADASYSYTDAILGAFISTSIGTFPTSPIYTKPVTEYNITNATTYIGTSEDFEKATAEINKQTTLLDQFGKDLYNELNKFNSDLENQKLAVQKLIEQAKLDQERLMLTANKTTDLSITNKAKALEKDIQLYQSKLQKYQEELSAYGLDINASVQTYQQNLQNHSEKLNAVKIAVDKAVQEYRANLEVWQTKRQTELAQYQADITNELNEFNKETEEYRANIQKAFNQANLDQQRLLAQAQTQVELNRFNAQKLIETALANNQQDAITKLQNEAKQTETDIVNRTKELERQIQEYQAKLGKYQEEIGAYSQDINKAVAKYSNGIQKYLGIVTANNSLIEQCRNEFKTILSLI